MKKIVTIKTIVCYRNEDFINQLTNTVNILQNDGEEVDIQYAFDKNGIYTALIIGREDEPNKHGSRKTI